MAEIRHSRTIALQATSPRIVPIELPARETDPLAELAKELKSGYPLKVTPPQQMGLVILKYRETLAAALVGDAASVKAFPSIARNYIDHARAYDSGGWQAVAEQVQINLRAVKAASTEGESEAQQPAPVTEGSASGELDYDRLATRAQLIAAFGSFTGMDMSWFKNLKDTPALFDARAISGQGGRGHIVEPLFYPMTVMLWLISPRRGKGRPMNKATGWRMLRQHFPTVYADHESSDPNTD